MNDRQQRFIKLLEEIFEINKSDLDFGIYRILNIKKAEITDFFRNRLPQLIETELASFATSDNDQIIARMSAIETQLGGKANIEQMPDSVPMAAEYRKLKEKLSSGFDMSALESDVYSALYSFFNRYYDEGDFISKRRYKEGVYALPYEGEDVKLYWANQDQYYIKTSENFRDYTFVADDITVHFRLVDATTEQNNNKESEMDKRVFMLFEEDPENYPGISTFSFDSESKELIIRFTYDIPQDKRRKYAEENSKRIVNYIDTEQPSLIASLKRNAATKSTDNLPLIQKHLQRYVNKNTFDYFIHKDLKGFLSRELDFYIKNEILHIDDIESEDANHNMVFFAKIRAIRKVARVIIDFLAQIENFQKKLWLKKKFVVETNWCITLDNIDESFYPEIAVNSAQTEDWVELFAIDKIEADQSTPAFSRPLTVDFLKTNKKLVLDTRHFSHTFRDRLVASIDNLDERTNGLMIHSENFQALEFLQTKYSHKVKCIYLDPPYNSPSTEIVYKNNYKNSSWLSLMNDRLRLSRLFSTPDGSHIVAIDKYEENVLHLLMENIFNDFDITDVAIEHNKKGVQGDHFSYSNEFAIFAVPFTLKNLNGSIREKKDWDWSPLRNWGDESLRTDAANCFFPILVEDNRIIGYGDVIEDSLHPQKISDYTLDFYYDFEGIKQTLARGRNVEALYPIDIKGIERKWRYAFQSMPDVLSKLKVDINSNGQKEIMIAKTQDQFKTMWYNPKYNAGDYGTKLLTAMGFPKKLFKFPKSIYNTKDCIYAVSNSDDIIFDYFAGSGTTGHAVMNLNREDNGSRRYILVEMGDYFDSVTKPRIEKAIYSTDWKNGVPTNRVSGISQIVKYMRLESYEDALSNVALKETVPAIAFGDEFMIKYMLDVESRDSLLNVAKFNEPFNFTMKITERNETHIRDIDPVETFNFLIGLEVSSKSTIAIFDAVPAPDPPYEGAVELHGDEKGLFKFQQI